MSADGVMEEASCGHVLCGARGSEGVEGRKSVILGFRVLTTSLGARGEGKRMSKG